MTPTRRRKAKKKAFLWLLAVVILCVAFGFRFRQLDRDPFWVDEAESSINALTILERGYPADVYLGLPIYENTSIQPWPGNPEYAFRDVSYSDNHFAIYHGWLPLYSIAASLAAYRITPDDPNPPHAIKHDLSEQKRRTAAARMPSALFGVAFVAVIFLAGKLFYGNDAAWAGLLLASIHPYAIMIARQARYYSAEVLMTTVCCLLLWLMLQRGEWKHFLLGAVAFILLFHTHLQSFFAAAVMVTLVAPMILRRHAQAIKKLTAFSGILAAGTIPWLVATGFYAHQQRIPRAWPLLKFPGDFLRYPPLAYDTMAIGALFAAAFVWMFLKRKRTTEVSQPKSTPVLEAAPMVAFLVAWVLVGYVSFVAIIPAVSFAPQRLNLSYWGPTLVLSAILCAAAARTIRPRAEKAALACAIILAIFAVKVHSLPLPNTQSGKSWADYSEATEQLRAIPFNDKTRFYASPNSHLIWTFYTGLPVQSMAPIRPTYLNSYRGDIVYIDDILNDGELLSPDAIRKAAQESGLCKDSTERWARVLLSHDYRANILRDIGARPDQELEQVPEFAKRLVSSNRERRRLSIQSNGLELITRGVGFEVRSWRDWRKAFFDRYAGDAAFRYGAPVNYAERLRGSTAVIIENSTIAIYYSRWHPPERNASIHFAILPLTGSIGPKHWVDLVD